MTKETRLEIINLCKFIFEDEDYIKVLNLLQNNQLNALRLFIDEYTEMLAITSGISGDISDSIRLQYCNKLEDLILNEVISST